MRNHLEIERIQQIIIFHLMELAGKSKIEINDDSRFPYALCYFSESAELFSKKHQSIDFSASDHEQLMKLQCVIIIELMNELRKTTITFSRIPSPVERMKGIREAIITIDRENIRFGLLAPFLCSTNTSAAKNAHQSSDVPQFLSQPELD